MIRRSATGSGTPAPRALTERAVRRVGGTVLAAVVGAAAAVLAVSAATGPRIPLESGAVPPRDADRPTRALARDGDASGRLALRLLPPSTLAATAPGWTAVHTEPHEPRALAGSCHRFPLVSVGALRVVHRSYTLTGPRAAVATADHVVARFADPQTAQRAYAVLLAWHAQCTTTRADLTGLRVSDVHELDGTARRYAVAWRTVDAPVRAREDVALVRNHSRLALVRVRATVEQRRASRATVTAAVGAAGDLLR